MTEELKRALNSPSLSWDNIKTFLSTEDLKKIESMRVEEDYYTGVYDDEGNRIDAVSSPYKRRLKKQEKLKEAVKLLTKSIDNLKSDC